jgi:hypothetical protein
MIFYLIGFMTRLATNLHVNIVVEKCALALGWALTKLHELSDF